VKMLLKNENIIGLKILLSLREVEFKNKLGHFLTYFSRRKLREKKNNEINVCIKLILVYI